MGIGIDVSVSLVKSSIALVITGKIEIRKFVKLYIMKDTLETQGI